MCQGFCKSIEKTKHSNKEQSAANFLRQTSNNGLKCLKIPQRHGTNGKWTLTLRIAQNSDIIYFAFINKLEPTIFCFNTCFLK